VTGLPAEYNGRFAHFAWRMDGTSAGFVPGSIGGNGIAVADNEVTLPFTVGKDGRDGGYTGSDTLAVVLVFADTDEPLSFALIGGNIDALNEADAVYSAVSFADGQAAVDWADAFKVAYITIANFPENFGSPIYGLDGNSGSISVAYRTILGSGGIETVRNGSLTVKYHHWEAGTRGYIPYVEQILDIEVSGGKDRTEQYLFTVPAASGKTTVVDFSEGVKQE
jgi:hypothetical protein